MHYISVFSLADNKLFALQNVFELNGRISQYPKSARGYPPSICYLLKQDDGALLLDTGYTAHEGSLLSQIKSIIDIDLPLHVFPMRINEFMSVCNAMPIAEMFNVIACYAPIPDIDCWLDFNWDNRDGDNAEPLNLKTALLDPKGKIEVGNSGLRLVDAFNAPIRLINTSWIYDGVTRTLFTSDMFTHFWSDKPEGPWILTANDDNSSVESVKSFLLNTRYWWLAGANIDGLRQEVMDVFERYEIETIAPAYGAILQGRDLVERQFSLLNDALLSLDKSQTGSEYVVRGVER